MKEKIQSSLGSFGLVLWLALSLVACVIPVIVLDFSFWWSLLVFAVVFIFNSLGGVVMFGLYIWAFIVAVQGPQSVITVIFYVCFVLYVLPNIISLIIALFSKK